MIGQHLYFLNNKKYITNITNLETVISEINSFYHTKRHRTIVCVHPSRVDNQLIPGDIQVRADALRDGIGAEIVF